MSKEWVPPSDLDPECLNLCRAINRLPGICTDESCCGHGEDPYRIWFIPDSLDVLPRLLYWFDTCYSPFRGWRTEVYTDCTYGGPHFMIKGPVGAYDQADEIAKLILGDLEEKPS